MQGATMKIVELKLWSRKVEIPNIEAYWIWESVVFRTSRSGCSETRGACTDYIVTAKPTVLSHTSYQN